MNRNVPARGTRALRRGRRSLANQPYHVITGTRHRDRVFADFRNGRMVVRALRHEQQFGHCKTLAYVLMPDHLHWLMVLQHGASLSTRVNAVKSASARAINEIRHRRGAIWQKGFYDRALRRDDDLYETAKYIIENPVRAGIVESVRDYPHWDSIWL